MTELKNWIINCLPSLVPCERPDTRSGPFGYSIKFGISPHINDPLGIEYLVNSGNTTDSTSILKFSLEGIDFQHSITKRIQFTPFYLSCISSDESMVYIIDFYEWDPSPTNFRIFYFQTHLKNLVLKVQLPRARRLENKNVFQIKDWFFGYHGAENGDFLENTLSVRLNRKQSEDLFLIVALSPKQPEPEELSLPTVLSKLNQVQDQARKNNILRFIRVQNPEIEGTIDELWSRNKCLLPDLKVDQVFLTNIKSHIQAARWTRELCQLLLWKVPLSSIQDAIKESANQQEMMSGLVWPESLIYRAYFYNDSSPEEIMDFLQKWWDQYSVALYQIKLKQDLVQNPEKIFLIYVLAVRHRLSWSENLYNICNKFSEWPHFALLAYLQKLSGIKFGQDNSMQFYPGTLWKTNVKEVKRGIHLYRYTRFGKKIYTSLMENMKQILKIDKEVVLAYDQKEQDLSILPAISPNVSQKLRLNFLIIKINEFCFHIPFLWKKLDLSLFDLKIRWIFKKDRFQLTLHQGKQIQEFEIDGERFSFIKSTRQKYYRRIKSSPPIFGIKVSDHQGRSYFIDHKESNRESIVTGWIQDRYGLFIENFNIRYGSRQKVFSVPESGFVTSPLLLPQIVRQFKIQAQRIVKNQSLNIVNDPVIKRYLNYSPQQGKGNLIVVLDDELYEKYNDISKYFDEYLSFQPIFIFKSEIKGKLDSAQIIFIDANEEDCHIKKNSSFSSIPFLSIGFKGNMDKTFENILMLQ
jgi:hypothetical protein